MPPFTLSDLKNAIPAHCFEPTLLESYSHLAWNIVQCAMLAAAFVWLDSRLPWALWIPAYLLYTWVQGVLFTGVWVIGHECGHGGFAKSKMVNDVTGYFLHTMLYVPYFSWQRSHSNHHHYTNNLAKDEVFVPPKACKETAAKEKQNPSHKRNPIDVVFNLTLMLTFGWPLYLIKNATGHASDETMSHFLPSSPIFKPKDYYKVVFSTASLFMWTAVLVYLGTFVGHLQLFKLYVPALFVNNAYLVAITFLQHTDSKLPHYDDEDWTWLRGALCTVDRTMGRWLDTKLHYIHSTHVCHHVFSRIPFYRAEEATRAMIPVLGEYYIKDDSSFLKTLYLNFRDCNYLQDTKGVAWWLEALSD